VAAISGYSVWDRSGYLLQVLVASLGLVEQIFEEDGVRESDGLQFFYLAARRVRFVWILLVAAEADAPDLTLGPLFDHKVNRRERRRRDGGGYFGPNGGETDAVLGEQLFQGDFGLSDLRGIVLALDGKSDLAFFEAVEHVAGGDGVQAGA